MSDTKRYDRFPAMAAMLRRMSPEGRQLIARWHIVIASGLRDFSVKYPREIKALGSSISDRRAAAAALGAWLDVMKLVSEVISDTRPADWCCPQGSHAWPEPCPQHGAAVPLAGDTRRGLRGGTEVYVAGVWHELGAVVRDS
jgi:hypothetical protein